MLKSSDAVGMPTVQKCAEDVASKWFGPPDAMGFDPAFIFVLMEFITQLIAMLQENCDQSMARSAARANSRFGIWSRRRARILAVDVLEDADVGLSDRQLSVESRAMCGLVLARGAELTEEEETALATETMVFAQVDD